MRRPRSHRSTRGFGLLEAIVALTLLAGTGLALFSWINQNLRDASRLRTVEQEARLLLSAQALVETVNPMQQPDGEIEAGALEVRWQAQAVQPVQRNVGFGGTAAAWWVGLYRLDVTARDRTQGIELRYEQWRVGLKRTEAPPGELP